MIASRALPHLPLDRRGPTPVSTGIILIGVMFTSLLIDGDTPSIIARKAAIGVGVSLALSFATDFKSGLQGLLRTDIVALIGAYAMTLLEFLFDQPQFDSMVSVTQVQNGIQAVMIGISGLAIGRHLAPRPSATLLTRLKMPVAPSTVLMLFWICFSIGMLNMLLSVDFSLIEMVYYWGTPRFSQPWQRGRLGDAKALLNEVGMLVYLVPPIAGVIFARSGRYSLAQRIGVGIALFFVLFYGFSGGTRNVFITYVLTFVAAYLMALPDERRDPSVRYRLKPILVVGASMVVMAIAVKLMLAFRNFGFWEYVLAGTRGDPYLDSEYFLDYNLWVISLLTDAFPERHSFLGFEIPYLALIRPIPRAIWPGKPEGLSVSIEEVVGVEGLTLAASFVGEAYMAGGMISVFLIALFFGLVARWWSECGSPSNSDLGVLVYASGFFTIGIAMRSMFSFTTATLPTIAAVAYCLWVTRSAGSTAFYANPYLARRH